VIIKGTLLLGAVTGGAYGVSVAFPMLVLYLYYAIMVTAGCIYGLRTKSFSYAGMALLMLSVYMLENNSEWWHINNDALAWAYIFTAIIVMIFQTDDGFKVSHYVAALLVLKWLVAITMDVSYLQHQILNFLSIAQWVTFTYIASSRIKLNRGYAKEDNPFALRVAWISNQLKTRFGVTPAG